VTHPPIPEVSADEAWARAGAGAVLLDVREADEWQAGHADGAVWIPMTELDARHDEVPRDRSVLVICRSGHRSGRVVGALVQAGVDAKNVTGGMQAWERLGHPVVRDDGAPGTVA